MITKDDFINYITKLENFISKQRRSNEALHEALEMDGDHILTFGQDMIDMNIELLASHFYWNAKDWIEWFFYERSISVTFEEKDGNTKIAKACDVKCNKTQKEYSINTLADLYDMLIDFGNE